MANSLSYDFLPWARRGLARAHTATTPLGTPALPEVAVGLTVRADDAVQPAPPVTLGMLGPGDVTGIDPRIVVRTEPRANTRNFEPNYLAAIDFDPPDFPWLMTPARADADQRLMPWVVLLVLRADEVQGAPVLRPGRPLPSVLLRPGAAVPLPALAESWLWAHVQLVLQPGESNFASALRNSPARNVSRLVCPRRLEPDRDWIACVVPAFDAGRRAGLGEPVQAPNAPAPVLGHAWAGTQGAPGLELPVYYHWEFSTGPAGDFEALARRLRAPEDYGATIQEQLQALGRIPVEIDADRLLQRGPLTPENVAERYVGRFEGALVAAGAAPPAEPGRHQQIAGFLDTAITAGDRRALGNLALDDGAAEVPLVGPPAYGAWHARRHALDHLRRDRWLEGLNLSAPNRLSAGVGTRLVQAFQEEFMQAAWEQVGDVLAAERLLNRLRLSIRALEALRARIAALPGARQLQLLAPAAARLKPPVGPEPMTLWGHARATSLPNAVLDGALRRTLSPARTLARRTGVRDANDRLVRAFASDRSAAAMLAVERFRVDGLAGLRVLDGMRLPTGTTATVTLPGFVTAIPVAQAQQLRTMQAQLGKVLVPGAWRSPAVSQKLRGGVLLDSHWDRIGQFASLLGADQRALGERQRGAEVTSPARTTMARGVIGVTSARPEGVLLSAERFEDGFRLAPTQGLWVDARNGALALQKAPVTRRPIPTATITGVGATAMAAALRPGQVGAVDIQAIRRLGNAALFNSLPSGVVQGAAGTATALPRIVLGPGGQFRPAAPRVEATPPPPQVGDRKSLTLLPPERREPVLDAFRRAWTDKLRREGPPPLPRRVSVAVVPFAVDTLAAQAVASLDVRTLATRRVGSMIGMGGARLELERGPGGVVGEVLTGIEQFVIAPTHDRVMAYPRLDQPLYQRLVQVDRNAFMPGVEDIPQDTILLVATNPRFVESCLVGANHEMNRELLWRGFPTDQRGTPFRRFWEYFDPSLVDIAPIHQWNQNLPIGGAGGAEGSKPRLALLVRGRLLARFPNANIYAVARKDGDEAPRFDGSRVTAHPIGGGALPPDITFFLFDIPPGDATKYWWVLEEPMTEPRFGFDDQTQPREVPRLRRSRMTAGAWEYATMFGGVNRLTLPGASAGETWLDVDWSELSPAVPPGGHVTFAQLRSVQLTQVDQRIGTTANAAHVARALLQRPFRGYFAGTRLVPA